MEFKLKPANRNISDEELIEDLCSVASIFGRTITAKEYDDNGKFSWGTLRDRFGGWNKALIRAGLELASTPPGVTEEDLFENLEEVWLKLGRQPKTSEMQKPLSRYSRETYRQRYGSWMNALERFVLTVNESIDVASVREEAITEKEQTIQIEFKHKTKRDVNWRMRFQVLARDNFRCVSCGLSPAIAPGTILHVDHILPWSKGGETVIENLQTLCATCNLGKGNYQQLDT